jgi:hypothetical protein
MLCLKIMLDGSTEITPPRRITLNMMTKKPICLALAVSAALVAAAVPASAAIVITEVDPYGSNPSSNGYSADWFELTNTGTYGRQHRRRHHDRQPRVERFGHHHQPVQHRHDFGRQHRQGRRGTDDRRRRDVSVAAGSIGDFPREHQQCRWVDRADRQFPIGVVRQQGACECGGRRLRR